MGVVEDFAELFEGRKDAYGTDAGGCVRIDDARSLSGGDDLRTSTWKGAVELHLSGANPIGVYPLVERGYSTAGATYEWLCKWGCVDLDVKTDKKPSGDYTSEEDVHCAAVNLQKTLKHFGVSSWIERTRSSGRHIWIFSSSWVGASSMRRALLVACSVAGCSTREINPKQTQLSEGQVGSYVRLAYPGALKIEAGYSDSRVMLDHRDGVDWRALMPFPLDVFVERALAQRTPLATLEHIASLYREPVRTDVSFETYPSMQLSGALIPRLSPLGFFLFWKPVDQISDRSMHIEAFVRASKDSGLSASETLTLADELAARCGKFDGRRDREDQLRRIVERAWT